MTWQMGKRSCPNMLLDIPRQAMDHSLLLTLPFAE